LQYDKACQEAVWKALPIPPRPTIPPILEDAARGHWFMAERGRLQEARDRAVGSLLGEFEKHAFAEERRLLDEAVKPLRELHRIGAELRALVDEQRDITRAARPGGFLPLHQVIEERPGKTPISERFDWEPVIGPAEIERYVQQQRGPVIRWNRDERASA
jgi:hypothetical protein